RSEDPLDGLADLVVGGRGAGGEADGDGPVGQPVVGADLGARGVELRLVADGAGFDVDAGGVGDVVGGGELPADVRQVVGVGGVVAADDDHDVGRVLHHLE